MDKLDKLIFETKPNSPDLSDGFAEKIMREIADLELTPGLESASLEKVNWGRFASSIILLILAALGFNLVYFILTMNGVADLLSFGGRFVLELPSYLPYEILVPAFLLTGASSWLMWNSRVFKKGVAVVALGGLGISTFGGGAVAMTGMNQSIYESVRTGKNVFIAVRWVYGDKTEYRIDHPNFKLGRVIEIAGRTAKIQDPRGQSFNAILPRDMIVKKGDIISLVGESSENSFQSDEGRHCGMMSAGRHFNTMPMSNHKMMRHHRMMRHK